MSADLLPVVAPRNVARGDAVLAGLIFGRATQTRTVGQNVLLRRHGVFPFPKLAGFATTAWTTPLYFADGDAGLGDDATKLFVAIAAESVGAGATSVRAVIVPSGPATGVSASGASLAPRFSGTPSALSNKVAKTPFTCLADLADVVADEWVRSCVAKLDATVNPTESGQVVLCLAPLGWALITAGDFTAGVAQLAAIDLTATGKFDVELDLDITAVGGSGLVDARVTSNGDTPAMSQRQMARALSLDLTAGLRLGAVLVPGTWGPLSTVTLSLAGERRQAL